MCHNCCSVDRNDGVRKALTWFLNQAMQQEALNQIKAQPYERADQRRARRSGTRTRSLKTIHGEIILDKPQFREVPFKTQVFDRYSRAETSLRITIIVSRFLFSSIKYRDKCRILKPFNLRKNFYLYPS
ncbi:MAG: transposase [Methanotrichaceae archaeon]